MQVNGIHHITGISGPAPRNLDFYTRVLGLRLVKKTVNFDDPTTYHLYYGDHGGAPGTILTFFPWAHVAPGRAGVGFTQETAFRVPESAIGYWAHRFLGKGVSHGTPEKRFGQSVLTFRDPDGAGLALIGTPGMENEPAWTGSDVPIEAAIRGLAGVTLMLEDAARTGAILTDVFGFREAAREGSLVRYKSNSPVGNIVDIREAKGFLPGRLGGGSIHHIAFRAADDATEAEMVKRLAENHDIETTEQRDRKYFRSVYFREPGGILFEIATDVPGFSVDEKVDVLGDELQLPPFLESRRGEIEAVLPSLS